jgi:hypothetical protein
MSTAQKCLVLKNKKKEAKTSYFNDYIDITVLFSDPFSVAKCLGARTVAPHLLEVLPQFNIISEVVTDAQAVKSCIKFAGLLHVVFLY